MFLEQELLDGLEVAAPHVLIVGIDQLVGRSLGQALPVLTEVDRDDGIAFFLQHLDEAGELTAPLLLPHQPVPIAAMQQNDDRGLLVSAASLSPLDRKIRDVNGPAVGRGPQDLSPAFGLGLGQVRSSGGDDEGQARECQWAARNAPEDRFT